MIRRTVLAALLALVVSACSSAGGPILANPTPPRPTQAAVPTPTTIPVDPIPVVLPRDDGPHDRLTEWWYYTGHVDAVDGPTFGFEFVIFRAERGAFPTTWASHLAITEETGGKFVYAQRSEIGPQVDRSGVRAEGFDLAITGLDPLAPPGAAAAEPWTMSGSDGVDRLSALASGTDSTAGAALTPFGLDLALRASKPAALHDGDGWIDFGAAGGSYYYSRTAMEASGTITLNGSELAVDGSAWFDHQWGDFISVGGSGWDWFAVNLDDGTDLTLSLVRDANGAHPLVYGTLVDVGGDAHHLDRDAFTVEATDTWTSPTTGAEYPAGWQIDVPGEGLSIRLRPTVADQELDTRATTGVVYWEGSQVVDAVHNGRPTKGEAYVELTGYAP
jgi:predicted secreted hydrolase